MRISSLVALIALLGAAACADTEPYTREAALDDLAATTDLSADEIECVLDGVEAVYSEEYEELQRDKQITDVSPEAERVYVKNRLAQPQELTDADREAFDGVVARCTSG